MAPSSQGKSPPTNPVRFSAERDDRRAGAPAGPPRTRDARDTQLDGEAVVLENAGHVALGLELLKAQLVEAVDHVDHLLGKVAPALHVDDRLVLEALEPGVLRQRRRLDDQRLWLWQRKDDDPHGDREGGGPGQLCDTHVVPQGYDPGR